ncbi:MAG: hypothetical protein R8G66_07670 [Cytophagales bacterium]|nr:hypothetical protein [Cytophagales bacterium]
MKGKYKPLIVLLPIFMLVLYVYWAVFFQNMVKSQSTKEIRFDTEVTTDIHPSEGLAIIHFYDPSCLIAKDNIAHLERIFTRYKGREAAWYIVTNKAVDTDMYQKRLGFQAQWVEDRNGEIAAALGVISTPMLVIVDDGRLFFRGTYLKNGAFCGADDITTSDAGIAIRSSMKGNQLPLYLKDLKSYIGCTL